MIIKSCSATFAPDDQRVMARPLRLEFAGAIYHLTSRGNDCQHKKFGSLVFGPTYQEKFFQRSVYF
jgi:hypothetical protein